MLASLSQSINAPGNWVEWTDLKFYNLGTWWLSTSVGDTLAGGVASMKTTNETFYSGKAALVKHNPILNGSKYYSFCPPLLKLWVDIAGMSYPTQTFYEDLQ